VYGPSGDPTGNNWWPFVIVAFVGAVVIMYAVLKNRR
jgi:hypothetical protein